MMGFTRDAPSSPSVSMLHFYETNDYSISVGRPSTGHQPITLMLRLQLILRLGWFATNGSFSTRYVSFSLLTCLRTHDPYPTTYTYSILHHFVTSTFLTTIQPTSSHHVFTNVLIKPISTNLRCTSYLLHALTSHFHSDLSDTSLYTSRNTLLPTSLHTSIYTLLYHSLHTSPRTSFRN